ncbi:hypothetical protein [Streptomyces sp. NRRL B-3648]|uniref:hypothetical protein n=1 Tax=Streptomyces sp. NRRL B-3648 TaxID=1519493 RepID=UPI00131C99ED|nr:hypothetical protein [Streptomyces sp. NRRL B-3648]
MAAPSGTGTRGAVSPAWYVGGPYDGGHYPDGEIDAIDIRRGGSDESGRCVLTEKGR